jgi:hypothetical protein
MRRYFITPSESQSVNIYEIFEKVLQRISQSFGKNKSNYGDLIDQNHQKIPRNNIYIIYIIINIYIMYIITIGSLVVKL